MPSLSSARVFPRGCPESQGLPAGCCSGSDGEDVGAAIRAVCQGLSPARHSCGARGDVLPVSPMRFAQRTGTVFQHSLYNKRAAVRGQRTSRLGPVSFDLSLCLCFVSPAASGKSRTQVSILSCFAQMSPLWFPRILSQSPDAFPTYCQWLLFLQQFLFSVLSPQSCVPQRPASSSWYLLAGVRFVGAGAVTQPGKFNCLQLSFAGLYLQALCIF